MEQKELKIVIPDGKTPEMTETASGCTIKWVDKPKEKTFEDYADEYRCGMPYAIVPSKKPMLWPFENRMGLLKYIANDLNESNMQQDAPGVLRYRLYVSASKDLVSIVEGSGKEPAVYFSDEAVKRARTIIPIEFILSF